MVSNLAWANREYSPLLDDMRVAMADYLGPLYWMARQDTDDVIDREGQRVVRVGPDFARAVPLYQVVPRNLSKICNQVLARHEFPEQPVMTGSDTGHLRMDATDGRGATLYFFLKADLEYWVDVPADRVGER